PSLAPPRRRSRSPYTTLFRSAGEHDDLRPRRPAGAHAGLDRDRLLELEVDEDEVGRERRAVHQLEPGGRHEHDVEVGRVRRDPADRKSTRLNSSHVSISYAVF